MCYFVQIANTQFINRVVKKEKQKHSLNIFFSNWQILGEFTSKFSRYKLQTQILRNSNNTLFNVKYLSLLQIFIYHIYITAPNIVLFSVYVRMLFQLFLSNLIFFFFFLVFIVYLICLCGGLFSLMNKWSRQKVVSIMWDKLILVSILITTKNY